jgi:hypothetical protein
MKVLRFGPPGEHRKHSRSHRPGLGLIRVGGPFITCVDGLIAI